MFNRPRIQAADFFSCFAAGVLIGMNATRDDSRFVSLALFAPFLALYAGWRFDGDFNQRTNRVIGMTFGMFAGAYTALNLRRVIAPPVSAIRP